MMEGAAGAPLLPSPGASGEGVSPHRGPSGRTAHSVRVGLTGCKEEDMRLVPRAKLTIDAVLTRFGVTPAFFEEAITGAIIWPARMVMDALPPPARYYLHPKRAEGEGGITAADAAAAAADALVDNAFKGETVILVAGVPPAATRKALTQWLMLGLEDEDPDLVAARDGIGALEAKLAAIDNQIALLPNLAVRVIYGDARGSGRGETWQRSRRSRMRRPAAPSQRQRSWKSGAIGRKP